MSERQLGMSKIVCLCNFHFKLSLANRKEIEGMMAIVVRGDALNTEDVQKAFDQIEEVDAVVSTIGGTPADPVADSQVPKHPSCCLSHHMRYRIHSTSCHFHPVSNLWNAYGVYIPLQCLALSSSE